MPDRIRAVDDGEVAHEAAVGKDRLLVSLLPPGRDRVVAQPAIKREPAELPARRLRRRRAAPVAQRQIVERANARHSAALRMLGRW